MTGDEITPLFNNFLDFGGVIIPSPNSGDDSSLSSIFQKLLRSAVTPSPKSGDGRGGSRFFKKFFKYPPFPSPVTRFKAFELIFLSLFQNLLILLILCSRLAFFLFKLEISDELFLFCYDLFPFTSYFYALLSLLLF